MNTKELIYNIGIVPVVKLEDVADSAPLAEALIEGGLPIAEITLRTPVAYDVIKAMKSQFPEMCVGAGTVLTIDEAKKALLAGAEFIVSPGFNEKLVEYCLEHKIIIIPGCSTATEVEKALSYGLTLVKIFPAEASGGPSLIKALSGPYSNMKFMPTGGINLHNMNEYLCMDKVIACGGSWMVDENLVKQDKFDLVRHRSEEAVKELLGIELLDYKIDLSKEINNLNALLNLFKAKGYVKDRMKFNGNYVLLRTHNLSRARYHLEQKGLIFGQESTFVYNKKIRKGISLKNKWNSINIVLIE